jgi:hypothetical protein
MGKFSKDLHIAMTPQMYQDMKELCETRLGGLTVTAFVRMAVQDKINRMQNA